MTQTAPPRVRSSLSASKALTEGTPTGVPLSVLLKTLTQPQHDEAERHPLHAILLGSQGPAVAREAYVRLLEQHLHLRETFEPLLRRAAGQSETLRSLVREHHFHLDALRADIDVLHGRVQQPESLPGTVRFVWFVEACARGDGCPLLGVLYVFEGSTNGGTIIARRLAELLSLNGETGTRFINPHGPLVRRRWAEWKAALDAIALDEGCQQEVIAAAQEAFRRFGAIFSDIHAITTRDV